MSVAICPHLSVDHYRGGEQWTVMLANRLAEDGVDVDVRALPYAPEGKRRVSAREVLDDAVGYEESWRHDLSTYDTSYVFYNPLSKAFFGGDTYRIAGIHSWAYVTDKLLESHYGAVPTAVKALYWTIGKRELSGFDAVHTCTPAFDSPNPNTHHIPNYVDTDVYHPDAAPTASEFTVLVTAARIREKGWDTVREVAENLAGDDVRVVATGEPDPGDDSTAADHVWDLGFLPERDLAAWYARSHVVLHPTRVDADSIVVKESLAAGTPVLTTTLPTHRTHEDRSAMLFGDTAEELTERIRGLREEWADGSHYTERARTARHLGERYDRAVVYPQLKALLTRDAEAEAETEPRAETQT